jgi:hypothetical protein
MNRLGFPRHFRANVAVPENLGGCVGIDYGVTGTPETYLIDQAGIVRMNTSARSALTYGRPSSNQHSRNWVHEPYQAFPAEHDIMKPLQRVEVKTQTNPDDGKA